MPLIYTLDEEIIERLRYVHQSVEDQKDYCPFDYEYFFELLQEIIVDIEVQYLKVENETLKESARKVLDNSFVGCYETFINHFNGVLFARKLQYKIKWHQYYGCFPKMIICK